MSQNEHHKNAHKLYFFPGLFIYTHYQILVCVCICLDVLVEPMCVQYLHVNAGIELWNCVTKFNFPTTSSSPLTSETLYSDPFKIMSRSSASKATRNNGRGKKRKTQRGARTDRELQLMMGLLKTDPLHTKTQGFNNKVISPLSLHKR